MIGPMNCSSGIPVGFVPERMYRRKMNGMTAALATTEALQALTDNSPATRSSPRSPVPLSFHKHCGLYGSPSKE